MDERVRSYIEQLISEIGKCRRQIEEKGEIKARAIKTYDMKLAVTMAILREDETYELAGKKYKSPPVSIMEKIAKGIVAEERYNLEVAEAGYKAAVCNLDAMQSQLNAYQSIYRYQE